MEDPEGVSDIVGVSAVIIQDMQAKVRAVVVGFLGLFLSFVCNFTVCLRYSTGLQLPTRYGRHLRCSVSRIMTLTGTV